MIDLVGIYLDDNIPEYMEGIIRCGSVIVTYSDGKTIDMQDMINNDEYRSEIELIEDIANKLNITRDIISILN